MSTGNATPLCAQRFHTARRSLPSTYSIAMYISSPRSVGTTPASNTGTKLPCESLTTILASSRKRPEYSRSASPGSTVLMTQSFSIPLWPWQPRYSAPMPPCPRLPSNVYRPKGRGKPSICAHQANIARRMRHFSGGEPGPATRTSDQDQRPGPGPGPEPEPEPEPEPATTKGASPKPSVDTRGRPRQLGDRRP